MNLTNDQLNRGFSLQDNILPIYPRYDFRARKAYEERQRKFQDYNRWYNTVTRILDGSLTSELFRDLQNPKFTAAEAIKKYAVTNIEELSLHVMQLMKVNIFDKHPEWIDYDPHAVTTNTAGGLIRQIRQMFSEGMKISSIAKLTGQSERRVEEIIINTTSAIALDENGKIKRKKNRK